MTPREIHLIRHAQSTWNAAGRWQGQTDPPLSDHGRAQAAELAAVLASTSAVEAVTHVVTSDLERARATAAPIATSLGLPIAVDADLREIDVGSWSGQTREQIRAVEPAALDRYFQGKVGWTGGESYEQHELRSARAVAAIEAHETDGAVVVVTHGGTLRAMVLTLLQLDPGARWRFTGIGHASRSMLTRGEHGWRLASFNLP